MKVFGTGLNKTATTSLGHAFKILGFKHTGLQPDLFVDRCNNRWDRLFECMERFDAFTDWPWGTVYHVAAQAYPDAKFVLTVRDADAWFDSVVNYSRAVSLTIAEFEDGKKTVFPLHQYRKNWFGVAMPEEDDRETFIIQYLAHNESVREYFADEPDRLLEIDFTQDPSWERLCEFLKLPVPNQPFPRENVTSEASFITDEELAEILQ